MTRITLTRLKWDPKTILELGFCPVNESLTHSCIQICHTLSNFKVQCRIIMHAKIRIIRQVDIPETLTLH